MCRTRYEKPQKDTLDLGKKYVETYSWSNAVAADSVERPALPASLLPKEKHYVINTVRTYSDYQRKRKLNREEVARTTDRRKVLKIPSQIYK